MASLRSVIDDGEAAVFGVAVAWWWLEGGCMCSETLGEDVVPGGSGFLVGGSWQGGGHDDGVWDVVERGGLDDGACSFKKLVLAGGVGEGFRVGQRHAVLHGALCFVVVMLYEEHECVAFWFDEDARVFAAANTREQSFEIAVVENVNAPIVSPGGWVTDAGCDVGVALVDVRSWR